MEDSSTDTAGGAAPEGLSDTNERSQTHDDSAEGDDYDDRSSDDGEQIDRTAGKDTDEWDGESSLEDEHPHGHPDDEGWSPARVERDGGHEEHEGSQRGSEEAPDAREGTDEDEPEEDIAADAADEARESDAKHAIDAHSVGRADEGERAEDQGEIFYELGKCRALVNFIGATEDELTFMVFLSLFYASCRKDSHVCFTPASGRLGTLLQFSTRAIAILDGGKVTLNAQGRQASSLLRGAGLRN